MKLSGLTPEWLDSQAACYSDHEIGASLGVNGATIRYHRRKHGIPSYTERTGRMKVKATGESLRRGVHSASSSENLKVDFFATIDQPEKAYWIGFLATDGCVSENSRIHLSQTIEDGDRVDAFAAAVGAEMFLRTRHVSHPSFLGQAKSNVTRVVRFTSKQMAADLENEGIVHRKTSTLCVSSCAYRFPQAYFRGCLDGDGTVGKINFKFSSGSRQWALEAQAMIAAYTGVSLSMYEQISPTSGKAVQILQGVRGSQPVLDWIYASEGGKERMERKYQRYKTYWLERSQSWWKDKQGARALVGVLPADLASTPSR